MAVPAIPFWLSAANQEFRGTTTGSVSATLSAAGIPAPRYASQLAGMSSVVFTSQLTIGKNAASTAYGYSQSVYGALTNPNYGGVAIVGLIEDAPSGNGRVGLSLSSDIGGHFAITDTTNSKTITFTVMWDSYAEVYNTFGWYGNTGQIRKLNIVFTPDFLDIRKDRVNIIEQ